MFLVTRDGPVRAFAVPLPLKELTARVAFVRGSVSRDAGNADFGCRAPTRCASVRRASSIRNCFRPRPVRRSTSSRGFFCHPTESCGFAVCRVDHQPARHAACPRSREVSHLYPVADVIRRYASDRRAAAGGETLRGRDWQSALRQRPAPGSADRNAPPAAAAECSRRASGKARKRRAGGTVKERRHPATAAVRRDGSQ